MKNKDMSIVAYRTALAIFNEGIVVSDDFLERTVNVLLDTASTGNVGDGKIFVSDVIEAYRIRTKESGSAGIN